MIFHVTYLSDGLKVKGYLSLPYGYHLPTSDLESLIGQFYGSTELTITEVASSIQPESRDLRSQQWPVFIYCRGGIGNVGRVKTTWIEEFSNFEHIIFAPTYRGNEGSEGRDEFGGSDQEDVLSAYHLLANLPFVDEKRISIMGFSRGSINATQTATQVSEVHKLILWAGVSDLAQTYEERIDLRKMLKRVIGGSPNKTPESFQIRSPIYLADKIKCPVLIMHGNQDTQVDFSQGQNMYNKLVELGVTTEFHQYDGCDHHLPQQAHLTAVDRMFQWITQI
ncbi:alpha/beta hydrolase family protein [Paenibacillus crassostreae]|uniref:Peptidase S9 n=1 Tax=Paenibacillus crassostreae TaxID=1763538 RepID=A0A167FH24_9BACL|nr:prolyl oligopeptidase family serine peptidase [Paenibacillus crassostreae]AOZ94411.1 peptidase S9 [Paenibacillus crassostreae]OAB76552.1 peptidase S9 [Paenibacillus crassostreae]